MLIIASKIVEILHSLTTYSLNALHNNSVRLLHTRSVQLLPYFGFLLLLLAAFSMRNFTEWAILCISKMYYLHSYTILLWHLPRLTISTYLAKWTTFTTGRKLYHPLKCSLLWSKTNVAPSLPLPLFHIDSLNKLQLLHILFIQCKAWWFFLHWSACSNPELEQKLFSNLLNLLTTTSFSQFFTQEYSRCVQNFTGLELIKFAKRSYQSVLFHAIIARTPLHYAHH